MGLLSLFGFGKKAELLEWQNDILEDAPDRLIMSEAQLRRTTEEMAQRDLKIIQKAPLQVPNLCIMIAHPDTKCNLELEKMRGIWLMWALDDKYKTLPTFIGRVL